MTEPNTQSRCRGCGRLYDSSDTGTVYCVQCEEHREAEDIAEREEEQSHDDEDDRLP